MTSLNNDNTSIVLKATMRLIASVVVPAMFKYVVLVLGFSITK
jgi:hypothetical protein